MIIETLASADHSSVVAASGPLSTLMDPEHLLSKFGNWTLVGLGIIVFIESGVLFPFLPGDSLLVTAAALRHELGVHVIAILAVATIAAILGDQVGFWLGRKFGHRLFKPDARILKTRYLHEAEEFFAKHGPAALVIGRFVPIVRTYVPFAAGTADMHYTRFVRWNILGAVTWVFSMVGLGYFLGNIPWLAGSIDKIILVIVFLSLIPIFVGAIQSRKKKKNATPPVE